MEIKHTLSVTLDTNSFKNTDEFLDALENVEKDYYHNSLKHIRNRLKSYFVSDKAIESSLYDLYHRIEQDWNIKSELSNNSTVDVWIRYKPSGLISSIDFELQHVDSWGNKIDFTRTYDPNLNRATPPPFNYGLCSHNWVKKPLFRTFYEDCSHCGMKREDFDKKG